MSVSARINANVKKSNGFGVGSFEISRMNKPSPRRSFRSRLITTSLFERFTERSIKSTMLAQEQARSLGKDEVCLV